MSLTPDGTSTDLQQTVADLQRQLTEARAERDEIEAQKAALAEVLSIINSSPGDLTPVFDAILEQAHRICGADLGCLAVYEGKQFRAVATHNYPTEYAALVRQPYGAEASVYARLVNGERYIHIPDVVAVPTPGLEDAIRLTAINVAGIRTVLLVPLRKENAFLGYFSAQRRQVRPYSEREITLIESFAAQVVIAMENARLMTETREGLEQQTAIADILRVISQSPADVQPVLDVVVKAALRFCGAQDALIGLRDDDQIVVARAHAGALGARLISIELKRQMAIGQSMSSGKTVHLWDPSMLDSDEARLVWANHNVKAAVAAPMLREGVAIGTVLLRKQEAGPFTPRQIQLLEAFAAQAVIAIENVRLLSETREALNQQTATAEVLQVINSSPGDLAPVFDAMLEKGIRLSEAAFGILCTFDGECFRTAAMRSIPAAYAEYLSHSPLTFAAGSGPAAVLAGQRYHTVTDLAADALTLSGDPTRRAVVEFGGARTGLAVGLRKDAALLGIFLVFRPEVRPFTEKQIGLLETFAAQAVIAMENARLINETREALDQQTATAEVLAVINSSSGNLAPVFETILAKAQALCGTAYGSLQLYDGEKFYAVAVHGLSEPLASRLREGYVPGPNSPPQKLLAGEDYVHIRDLAERDEPIARVAVEPGGHRTFLSVALRRESKFLGQIVATRKEVRPFADKEISLLRSFAAQAVIAMENARLLGQLRERTDQIAELNLGLEARIAEQVEELSRVGRLKRFLAPQLAELIVSQGDEKILESHRREIVVVFCDLRGYTAFAETAEPEEVLDFLREYHGALGPLVSQFEGTLDQFSGDGIMVFFNDPVPIPDPAERAVKMAVAMREAASSLTTVWQERGRELGFGTGIAQGYATLGQIGFSERSGYTAIGTVCNVAARLCGEAKNGQILLSQRVNVALKGSVATEQVGALALKGLTRPVVAYNVPLTANQPALRVIDGGNH